MRRSTNRALLDVENRKLVLRSSLKSDGLVKNTIRCSSFDLKSLVFNSDIVSPIGALSVTLLYWIGVG